MEEGKDEYKQPQKIKSLMRAVSRESASDVQKQGWRNGGIEKTENRQREGEREGGGKV